MPFNPKKVVGKLCLEGTCAIYYYARTKDGNVAGFFFPNFPIEVKDLFNVDIDLNSKEMVRAQLDDELLTPSETLILLWFNTISANHVKLHAFANWGLNVEKEQISNNAFHARNSLITVIYNYFGYSVFGSLMPFWTKLGLLDKCFRSSLIDVFDHGIYNNLHHHDSVRDLIRHSNFVKFIIRVRPIFMNEFNIHKQSNVFLE